MSLFNAGIEPLVLAFEVELPVLLEVAVADDGSEGEDGLGAVQAPPGSSDVETVGYEMAACALDDAGRDRPAGFQGLVVVQELALVSQVADARVGPGAPAASSPAASASAVISAAARSPSPARTARALTATQSSAAGSPAVCRLHALAHVLQDVDYVDDDVDGDAAAGGLGVDQGELVLGAVDEDDPGPQAAGVAGTGLAERGGDHVRGVLADGPGQPLGQGLRPGPEIADVSGKGVAAAILAQTLQGMVYMQLVADQALDQIAAALNRYICAKDVGKYATMIVLRLESNGQLEYINCGQIHPLLRTPTEIVPLSESNLPVGLLASGEFHSHAVKLEPGTRLLVVTDGVTEAEDEHGDFFGNPRMEEAFGKSRNLEEFVENLSCFCGTAAANDDCTMVEICFR